ncbi:MAG: 30S ribosomal protein S21 [Elusimicrobiota bacterium]
MVFVRVKEDEAIETGLRRFKRQCQRAGIPRDIRRREHCVPPSVGKQVKRRENERRRRRSRRRRSR